MGYLMNRLLTLAIALTVSLTLAISTTAKAQLEEIIVTATKKEESLQDVSVSVSVVTGERIKNSGFHDLKDIGQIIPNFSVNENAISTIATMRGVGVGSNQSFEQSVGLFVDGVHLAKGRQFRTGMFDVERVEVLRGPQGARFGKNTLTGAVNVISAKAEIGGDLGGSISFAGEDQNSASIMEGNLNIPVSDTFAIRLAFKDREDDGYMENVYLGTKQPTADEKLLKFAASWQPNDDLRIDLKHLDSTHVRVGSTVAASVWNMAMPPTPTAGLAFSLVSTFFPNYVANVGTYVGGEDLNLGASKGALGNTMGINPVGTDTQASDTSINISYDMANDTTMNITVGSSKYDFIDGIDADFGPLELVSRDDWQEYKQDSVEIRFTSSPDSDIQWTAGAYWEDQYQDIDRLIDINGEVGGLAPLLFSMGAIPWRSLFTTPPGVLIANAQVNPFPFPLGLGAVPGTGPYASGQVYMPGAPLYGNNGCELEAAFNAYAGTSLPPCTLQNQFEHLYRIGDWTQNTDAKAIFGTVSVPMSDTVELQMGLRYVKEVKDVYAATCLGTDTTGNQTCNASPFIQGILGTTYDTWTHEFNEGRETDNWLPALQIEKRLSEDHMIYFSFSKGYKSGGFNAADDQNPVFKNVNGAKVPVPNVPDDSFEFDDETATSYEIGGKHDFNDSVRFNWAVAHAEYKDQQVSTFQGTGFIVNNAASSIVDTVEIDLTWQATEQLRVQLAAAYLDANFDKFDTAACTENQTAYFRALDPTGGADGAWDPKQIQISTYGPNVTTPDGACRIMWNGAGFYNNGYQDLSGQPRGAGKYDGSLIIDYVQPISNDLMLMAGLDFNFFDAYGLTGDNDPLDVQEASHRLNARLGVTNGQWTAMIYGKNITNEKIAAGGFDTPLLAGAHSIYLAETRIVGARVSYDF